MTIPRIADYPMPIPANYPANAVRWQVEPERAVLLIHDMQVYFLQFYAEHSPLVHTLVQHLVLLRDWADRHGVPVVYTAQPQEQTAGERGLLNDMWGPGLTVADASQQRIVAALTPRNSDQILTKWRYSAFQRTKLVQHLAGWKRDQLIIGGVYAHIGCLVTAVDAFMHDIQAFLVADAVADFSESDHRMALKYVATRCGHVLATSNLVPPP